MAWVSAVGRFGTATPGQCTKGPQVLPHATHRASPGYLQGLRGSVNLRLSAPPLGLVMPTVSEHAGNCLTTTLSTCQWGLAGAYGPTHARGYKYGQALATDKRGAI